MKWFVEKRVKGFTLLEMMLVLVVIALILIMVTRQYIHQFSADIAISTEELGSYRWMQYVAQVRQNIAELQQAANAYYYAHCNELTDVKILYCDDLVKVGGFPNLEECNRKLQNPWSSRPFQVHLLPIAGTVPTHYMVSIWGRFELYPHQSGLGTILGAGGSGKDLVWNTLPSYTNTPQGVFYRLPGNVTPMGNATAVGGSPINSGLWVMNGGLREWSKTQAEAIRKQKERDPTIPAPTVCPQ